MVKRIFHRARKAHATGVLLEPGEAGFASGSARRNSTQHTDNEGRYQSDHRQPAEDKTRPGMSARSTLRNVCILYYAIDARLIGRAATKRSDGGGTVFQVWIGAGERQSIPSCWSKIRKMFRIPVWRSCLGCGASLQRAPRQTLGIIN